MATCNIWGTTGLHIGASVVLGFCKRNALLRTAWIKSRLFADDSKLYWPIDSVRSPALLQSDLDGLHSWSRDHRMTFNTTKCKVLRMSKRRSRRKPPNKYHLGEEVQYRSEISGQRTRKTHAQFLRKRVLKNACGHAHLRAFDARVSFCYSLA